MNLEDTIVAIATPPGQSGIGIVRMSGKRSFPIAKKIFRPPEGKKLNWSFSFRIYYGWIVNPETKREVDEVLLTLMRSPKTYTREDIVEINCHGGPIPLRKTLELILKLGARLAEPGEFTKRAFLNGRIDLVQAESVLDIIQAKTEKSLDVALNSLEGKLSQRIFFLKNKMVDLLSCVEAEIDFSSEDLKFLSRKDKKKHLEEILKDVDSLLETAEMGGVYKEGVKAVIVGKSNVGKSSLLNTLLQRERAIVSYIPGTTRDTLEEMVNIKGFPVWVVDTAGLKEAKGIIEKKGIARTQGKVNEADIILLLIDGSCPLSKDDKLIFQEVRGKQVLIAINKIDLPQKVKREEISPFLPGRDIIEISATKEINIEVLKEKLANFILKEATPSTSDLLIMNLRQKGALKEARKSVKQALNVVEQRLFEELIAFDLREGINNLGEITGEVAADEVLDRIFSRFCIGK
ncbi:MAG: tRNA uridine-5-carboxymethylaminomethyl(34) synthesis GTPase MnmE [Candidatus Aerophobetes bacterium]|nr:tRNA uridine-5-carboxymethylaminomethyl(34) synthesis GTPase MnmE [Candidatus Aerophobetes bacterium]